MFLLDNPERYSDDNFSLEDFVDDFEELCDAMVLIRSKNLDVQHNEVEEPPKKKTNLNKDNENCEEKEIKHTIEMSLKR